MDRILLMTSLAVFFFFPLKSWNRAWHIWCGIVHIIIISSKNNYFIILKNKIHPYKIKRKQYIKTNLKIFFFIYIYIHTLITENLETLLDPEILRIKQIIKKFATCASSILSVAWPAHPHASKFQSSFSFFCDKFAMISIRV